MRVVSRAGIRLDPPKSTRLFKGIICDDISEFESYMPSQAVRSPPAQMCRCQPALKHSLSAAPRYTQEPAPISSKSATRTSPTTALLRPALAVALPSLSLPSTCVGVGGRLCYNGRL